jgi:hypothetical protein
MVIAPLESGTRVPHFKTLSRFSIAWNFRQVLECGATAPLFVRFRTSIA